jgi:CRP/FNR family transcriptional regulator, anaerobic regulatory protein
VRGRRYGELTSLTADQPAVVSRLFRVFGRGTLDAQDHVQVLMRRQADERIALFLLSMLQRYRKGVEEQAASPPTRVTLPMSREDVARYLGLALETVSRGLTRMQEGHVIEVSGRQIRVLDLGALEKLARIEDPPDCGGQARHA